MRNRVKNLKRGRKGMRENEREKGKKKGLDRKRGERKRNLFIMILDIL